MLRIILDIFTVVLLLAGFFFLAVGTVGLIRLPDVYTRMHATSKCDTLGVGLVVCALVFRFSTLGDVSKLLLAGLFLWIISPTTAHVVARAARAHGVRPVRGTFWIDRSESYINKEFDEG
jgi:multicomponent Na+:H+ antiporter subunit G